MMQRGELGQDSLYRMNDELLSFNIPGHMDWLEEQMPDAYEALQEMLAGTHIFTDNDHIETIMVALRLKNLLTWDNDNIQVRIWW